MDKSILVQMDAYLLEEKCYMFLRFFVNKERYKDSEGNEAKWEENVEMYDVVIGETVISS